MNGTFLELVRQNYGNLNARFLKDGERMRAGQKVMVFVRRSPNSIEEVQELEQLVEAKAIGRRDHGGAHLLWTQKNGRKWQVSAKTCQILVEWLSEEEKQAEQAKDKNKGNGQLDTGDRQGERNGQGTF